MSVRPRLLDMRSTGERRPPSCALTSSTGCRRCPGNVKLYYMGPMFRRERPQKGRYRQFYQIGAEVLGSSDAPGIDAEVIEMLMTLFERLKLKGAVLNINSIGDKNCRPAYVEKLRAELQKVREQLGRGQPAAHRDESAARAGLEARTASRPSSRSCRASPIIFAPIAARITTK